ncbi:hypothetical protein [Limnohabitans sp.]|uniref:hypothetical protein n=1 Tax=Limnohabitans sp. TaxID=1907725 RepID=UPI00286EE750|nr:hypothetical protein [Limnohabitans sp.]
MTKGVTNVPPKHWWVLAREAVPAFQKHPQTWLASVSKKVGFKYKDMTANSTLTTPKYTKPMQAGRK